MIERITSKFGPKPKFPYTPCIRAGNRAIVSGMVGIDPRSNVLCEGGVKEQTQRIFANLRVALLDYGFTLNDLLIARVYLHEIADFAEFNRAWEYEFSDSAPPARTTVGVNGLPLGAAIEIEFEFAR